MKVLNEFDVNQVNRKVLGTSVSIYSLINELESQTHLIGCGLWDRENMPHSNAVKNFTPGIVFRVSNQTGAIQASSPTLNNIVYPMVPNPWGHLFVGCRTGAAYLMDQNLKVDPIGSYGTGIYGVAYSQLLDLFLIGGRNGRLYAFNSNWELVKEFQVSDDRLWNLCMDTDNQHVWSSSYNHRLFKIDLKGEQVEWQEKIGRGATTLINWLENGLLAVGCMFKSILLLYGFDVIQSIPVDSPVCFVMDLPGTGTFFATGYKGQIWRFDYAGRLVDEFILDSRENNPIWIAQPDSQNNMVFAWANGAIRTISMD